MQIVFSALNKRSAKKEIAPMQSQDVSNSMENICHA